MLTVLGAALGLSGAIAVGRVLQGLLYGVTPVDGLTIASVVALLPPWRSSPAGMACRQRRSDDGTARGV